MRKFLLVLLLGFSGISLFGVSVNWVSAYDKLSVLSFGKKESLKESIEIADDEIPNNEEIDYIFYSRDYGEFQAFINLRNASCIRFVKDYKDKCTKLVTVFRDYTMEFSTDSKADYPFADIEINGRILMLTDGTGWDVEIDDNTEIKIIPYLFSNGTLKLSKFEHHAEKGYYNYYDNYIKTQEAKEYQWCEVLIGKNIGVLTFMKNGIGINSSYATPTYSKVGDIE